MVLLVLLQAQMWTISSQIVDGWESQDHFSLVSLLNAMATSFFKQATDIQGILKRDRNRNLQGVDQRIDMDRDGSSSGILTSLNEVVNAIIKPRSYRESRRMESGMYSAEGVTELAERQFKSQETQRLQ